jgi:hypothetical protein
MSSDFDPTNATPWSGTPGLYAIFNLDGQTALDEDRDGKPPVIHGWSARIFLARWGHTDAVYTGSTVTLSTFPMSTSFGSWQTSATRNG